ncbi:hypothetical protein TanjilG_20208 [Lupinus angustifolius]|uniref:Uncharacterized protein n=1 Tax=Lupinus angustifolius TaxID=3871 RepID=A0A1J7HGF4_LUPAN|nr:hypothetical protein TanjilG_20208 [Lupinus angustifolius]
MKTSKSVYLVLPRVNLLYVWILTGTIKSVMKYIYLHVSLRDPLLQGAADHELREIIRAVKRKKASHAGIFDMAKTANSPMIHIGR